MNTPPDRLFNRIVSGETAPAPSTVHLGWKLLAVDPAAGTLSAAFLAREEFVNPAGLVQGGFLAAMLDETMGPTIGATLEPGEFAPFLELKVNFLRPAKPGRMTGHGRVIQRSRNVAFLSAELHDARGRVVATATATAQVMRRRT